MITVAEHPNAAIVRAGYEAFNTGDVETLTGLFDPDVTLLQPGRSAVSGLYDGRDAVFGFFGELAARSGGTFRIELQDLYANDTQVVAVHRGTGTRGDDTLAADAALVFELIDGVVTAITVHQQRQAEWDAFFSSPPRNPSDATPIPAKGMTMSAQDVTTIRNAYEAFDRHDIAAALAILDAQAEWNEAGGGASPSGTFIGPDAVASGVFAAIGANFDDYHADPSEFTDEGDRVVVRGRFTGKNKGGAVLDTGFEHIFDMRDGKVVRFENTPTDTEAWVAGWSS